MGSSPLMQSVLEEKMHRIAEVLLGSVTPFQLMMGKLLGMVGVSLTVVTIYLLGAFYAIRQSGYGALFPAHVVWWFVVFTVLAVFMYGSVFCSIGAAVSDMKEAQSMMTPVMLVVMMPLFVWLNVTREPNATWSLIVSLFPPATPMLMTLRQAVPPGIPLWQPAVGMGIVLLCTVLCVFVAGRVFRVGILLQGKGANIGQMLRWALRG
jgi:ABC-type Na+ efflux pump permease subunit